MITVIDQAKAWLAPSSTLAASIQPQEGAHMIMKGTGRPSSQPATRIGFRPTRSDRRAATRFSSALVTPKLTMNETIAVFDARPNSRSPMSGTTVRSRPTMAPTKALISTRSEN